MKFYSPFELYFWIGTLPFVLGILVLSAATIMIYIAIGALVRHFWKAKDKITGLGTGLLAFAVMTFGVVEFTQNYNNQSEFVAWLVGTITLIVLVGGTISWITKQRGYND